MHQWIKCLAAAALLAAANCTPGAAPEPSWEPLPSRMRSAVRFAWDSPTGQVATFRFQARGREVVAVSTEFRDPEGAMHHSPWYPTPTGDSLRVHVTLHTARGDSMGAGAFWVPLREGWLWNVSGILHRHTPGVPRRPCPGCEGLHVIPLRPIDGLLPGDSLDIWWGGRAIDIPSPPS